MKNLLKGIIPIAVLLFGLVAMLVLSTMGKSAEKSAVDALIVTVNVQEIQVSPQHAMISGRGVSRAAHSVELTPTVVGVIVSTSPELMPGGLFKRGDALAKIDPKSYQASVATAQSNLANARLNLEVELGRTQTAKREWSLLGKAGESPDLASRRLHLEAAEGASKAAEAALAAAERDLRHTSIRAPFDGVIASESLEVGQLVSSSRPVATLIDMTELWVEMSVPVERVNDFSLPGSVVTVTSSLSDGGEILRTGEALRLVGQLDQNTRTATLLVSIPNANTGDIPLLPGAMVSLGIRGKKIPGIAILPRKSVTETGLVWLLVEGALASKSVTIAWGESDTVAVKGLSTGDQVIISTLTNPVEGTHARLNTQ